jgi:hypothetical protein
MLDERMRQRLSVAIVNAAGFVSQRKNRLISGFRVE